ncbi:cytochrome P450 90D2 [Iris pallida]|uniref:Cytochrome P450 90D2 n=1 Tax=Iris pallida TaxID=29817 RepID=A0AAX6ELV4_IRIPA|nr:cytochrome P450 90D2 [Iris pallida]
MPLMMTLVALLLVPAAILLCRSEKFRRWRQVRASLPRGSLGWPLIGETLDFISCAFSLCPEDFMNRRRLMYGKVFKSHLFGCPTVVSTDAEFSRLVLQSDARAFVPWYPKSLTELMGKSSILLINGSLQKRFHGLIGAFFRSPHLKSQITTDMEAYVQQSMGGWQDGQLIRIQDQAKHIVFQILVKGLIGLEPGEEMHFLKQQFQEFIAGLMSLPVKLPGSRLYRSLQASEEENGEASGEDHKGEEEREQGVRTEGCDGCAHQRHEQSADGRTDIEQHDRPDDTGGRFGSHPCHPRNQIPQRLSSRSPTLGGREHAIEDEEEGSTRRKSALDRLHVPIVHTRRDNGDAATGQHHQRDHADGGEGHRGEGAFHPQGVVRLHLLPIGPPRRRPLRGPQPVQSLEVEGQRYEQL